MNDQQNAILIVRDLKRITNFGKSYFESVYGLIKSWLERRINNQQQYAIPIVCVQRKLRKISFSSIFSCKLKSDTTIGDFDDSNHRWPRNHFETMILKLEG